MNRWHLVWVVPAFCAWLALCFWLHVLFIRWAA